MALGTMRQLSANMADETVDVSNKEQLVICIRWVDDCFVIQEDFIEMLPLERRNAYTKECPTENKFKHPACPWAVLWRCGAEGRRENWSSYANGKCLYTHCYGHTSNLAVADAIKALECFSDSLKTVREIGKLVEKPAQRNKKWDEIRAEARMTHVVYMCILPYQMDCAWRSFSSSYQ